MRQRRKAGRRRIAVAALLLAVGALLLSAGAASGSSLIGAVAKITFWDNYDVVTMSPPSMCPATNPQCVWQLFVNEPDIPAQTLVGTATGPSGSLLTVPYPANFCGVLQADVLVGPAPWRLVFGHQQFVQSGTCGSVCPTGTSPTAQPVSTASSPAQSAPPATVQTTQSGRRAPRRGRLGHQAGATQPTRSAHRATQSARQSSSTTLPTTSTTQATTATTQATTSTTGTPSSSGTTSTTQPSAQAVTCGPITGDANTVPASSLPFTGTAATVPATDASTQATLPFTGMDIKPLMIAGTILVFLGLGIATTHQQRQRAAARLAYSVRASRGAAYSRRAARWFLGD